MSWLKHLFGRKPDDTLSHPTDSPPELAAKLLEAERFADQLQDYLFDDTLFWQISVETPLGARQPKMTLGSLYERMHFLDEYKDELGPGDLGRLIAIRQAWTEAQRRFPEQWQEKLLREYKSFMHSWEYFLAQRGSNAEGWEQDYKFEVRNYERARLALKLLGPRASADLLKGFEAVESPQGAPPGAA